ncbi:hypothetical protein GCM10022384_07480 [Streptomyces marokkonensis]|uniref:Uncharacterized protein n=1 Tax=Streptomyces marokkonensis TaxID=324855 RepID=A0ABP7NYZ5_9ACTN
MAMTAAEHFEKAEELLEESVRYWDDEKGLRWGILAQAHLDAARLLFDIEQSNTVSDPARLTGLGRIAQERRAK